MLQDLINKQKKLETILTPEDRQQISNDCDVVLSRTAEIAARRVYDTICDAVAV